MKTFLWDLGAGLLVKAAGGTDSLTLAEFKAGDLMTVRLKTYRTDSVTGTVAYEDLPAAAQLCFSAKTAGKYDEDPPVIKTTTWTKTGTGQYEGTLSFSSSAIDTLLNRDDADDSNDTAYVDLMGEFSYSVTGKPNTHSNTPTIRIHNDVCREADGLVTETPAYPALSEIIHWYADISDGTGGGSTKLDGIVTAGVDLSGWIAAYYSAGDSAIRMWRFLDWTDEVEDGTTVILPDDFDSSTNPYFWSAVDFSGVDLTPFVRTDGTKDITARQKIKILSLGAASESTIVTGVATIAASWVALDTEGDGVADDCDTFSAGNDGDILAVCLEDPDRVVTLKHGTDNIFLQSEADFVMDGYSLPVFLYVGALALWVQIGDLGGGGGGVSLPVDDATEIAKNDSDFSTRFELAALTANRVITQPDADVTLRRDNLSASTKPAATNDVSEGYAVGSLWWNLTKGILYRCSSAVENAAVWEITNLVLWTETIYDLTAEVNNGSYEFVGFSPVTGKIIEIRATIGQTNGSANYWAFTIRKNGTTTILYCDAIEQETRSATEHGVTISSSSIAAGDYLEVKLDTLDAVEGLGVAIFIAPTSL